MCLKTNKIMKNRDVIFMKDLISIGMILKCVDVEEMKPM